MTPKNHESLRLPKHVKNAAKAAILLLLALPLLLSFIFKPDPPQPLTVEDPITRESSVSRSAEREALPSVLNINDSGTVEVFETRSSTLREGLKEFGLVLGENDTVNIPLDTPLTPGATLEVGVTRTSEKTVAEEEVLPNQSVEVEDPNLLVGKQKVLQEGSPGSTKRVFTVTVDHNGSELSRQLLLETRSVEPVERIVAVGTKPLPAPPPPPPAAPSTPSSPVEPGSAREIGREMVLARGWGEDQFGCLDKLWNKESRWSASAENRSSGAYGIPQALPGSKMASVGADWRTNPRTQIEWGLGYIEGRYGTPCDAWSASQAKGWY